MTAAVVIAWIRLVGASSSTISSPGPGEVGGDVERRVDRLRRGARPRRPPGPGRVLMSSVTSYCVGRRPRSPPARPAGGAPTSAEVRRLVLAEEQRRQEEARHRAGTP